MDRQKIAALFALALAAGGAWWWWRGRSAPLMPPAVLDLGGAETVFERAADAVQSFAEDVVNAVTPGPWSPPAKAAPYLSAIYAAEDAAGAPRNTFARQIKQESNFNPNAVNARSGAKGLGQFVDATWGEWGGGADVFDPLANIDAMGRYMRWLYDRHGSWRLALAAYNWGTGNVARKGMGRAPAETRAYVAGIAGDIGLA